MAGATICTAPAKSASVIGFSTLTVWGNCIAVFGELGKLQRYFTLAYSSIAIGVASKGPNVCGATWVGTDGGEPAHATAIPTVPRITSRLLAISPSTTFIGRARGEVATGSRGTHLSSSHIPRYKERASCRQVRACPVLSVSTLVGEDALASRQELPSRGMLDAFL